MAKGKDSWGYMLGVAVFTLSLFLFPLGSDVVYWLIIENFAGGNYGLGMLYAYLITIIGMIIGMLMMGSVRKYLKEHLEVPILMILGGFLGVVVFPRLAGYWDVLSSWGITLW